TGGTQIASGATFTTPSLNSTTTYFAQAAGSGCNSVRTPVVASINITTPPNTSSASRCGTGTVSLQASSSDTIYWYSSAVAGSPIATGTMFTTPSIANTTTYYVQANQLCPSSRTAAIAVISAQAS